MARHIIIGGVDRFSDYLGGTLEIKGALSYLLDTAAFQVRGDEPAWGSVVFIEDDEQGRLFGGIIQRVAQLPVDPIITTRVWQVECDDFTTLLNRMTVTERYEGVTATEVFLDLVARFTDGFTVASVKNCADVIEYLDLVDVPIGQAFTMVCEYVGWHWFPDAFKDLHFFSAADAEPAPLVLIPGGNFTGFSRTVDGQGVRNRILVRGGMGQSDSTVTRTWAVSPTATEYVTDLTPRKLSSVALTGTQAPGGGPTWPLVIGWDGLDDEAMFDFMANPSSKALKPTDRIKPFLVAGGVLTFIYWPEIPIILTVDDLESQAAMAYIFGGNGIIEATLVDTSLTNLAQAEAAGLAELRAWANPKVNIQFNSHATGWHAGQVVQANLPDRGVDGSFIIQEAEIRTFTADDWQTTVRAGSTLFGLADFIGLMAKKQKAERPTEIIVLNKVVPLTDAMTLEDSVETATTAQGTSTPEVGYGEVGVSSVA